MRSIAAVQKRVVRCRLCPRLVAHRERVADEKTKRFAEERYWGKPVPAFGDADARILIVGLAPAAHGANRTGRMFTGDRSGDFLYRVLYDAGLANQPESMGRDDGLHLKSALVTAVARCAPPGNKPTPSELDNCRPYLVQEIERLRNLTVVLALGRIAFDGFLAAWRESGREAPRPKPSFGHGFETSLSGGITLLASYHPSQQNTFTGRLTPPMLAGVVRRARRLAMAMARRERSR